MARRFGDQVRVSPDARGERTGTSVQGRIGTVVDHMPPGEHYEHERYWIRFGMPGRTELFYDWVVAGELRDY